MSQKPKCQFFGCTIPRGIPHEHPYGAWAVMRDPVAPLTADELKLREALIAQNRGMQNCAPGSPLYDRVMGTKTYIPSGGVPVATDRKLLDALHEAGMAPKNDKESIGTVADIDYRELQRRRNMRYALISGNAVQEPKPRHSFIRLIGSIA